MRIRSLASLALAALFVTSLGASRAPTADARGGGGGFGGGGMGFGGGGFGGGFGGKGGQNNPFGNNGMSGTAMKHLAGKRGNQGEQALAELEDRKNLIAERRKRLADNDRVAHQEARLAADRLAAAGERCGDDVR
jgi:hypothetical protein